MLIRHGALALLIILPQFATASTLIEDINFELTFSPVFPIELPGDYLVKLYTTTTQQTSGSMIFRVEASQTLGLANLVFLDVDTNTGSDWYRGDFGQLFSAETIANGLHERWSDLPFVGTTIEVPTSEDLWFGVNTGRDFSEQGVDRDIFGWVQFVIDDDLNVNMVDNAMAFDSGQILLGRNLIPEPSANSVISLAFIGWLLSSRIRK